MKLSSLNTKIKLSTNALLLARGKNGWKKILAIVGLRCGRPCTVRRLPTNMSCFAFDSQMLNFMRSWLIWNMSGWSNSNIAAKSKAKRCTCLKLRPNLVLEVFVTLLVEIFVTLLVLVEIFASHCCRWWKYLSRETQQANCCWTGNRCKRCLQRSRPACISRQPGERLSFLNIEIDLLLQQLPL